MGAQESQISYNVLHNKWEEGNIGSTLHGEHDSPVILNKNGWGEGRYQKPWASGAQLTVWQYVLEKQLFQSGQRWFSDILSSQVCVCFSPFSTHWKGSSESKSGSVSNAHNSPSMARSTMVSRVQPTLKDLLKDRRTSSSKHHESACKKWCGWCS